MALILDISVSLDGFVAGPNRTLDEPLGKGGDKLHGWAFATASFRETHALDAPRRASPISATSASSAHR